MTSPKLTVSKLWIAIGAAMAGLFLGGAAYACTSGCTTTPPSCCTPPSPPPRPPKPPTGCNGGCNGGGGGKTSVNVNVNVNASASASASGSAGAGASAGSTVYYGGGAHGGYYSGPQPTGYIDGLNVVGAEAARRTAYEATRTKFKRVVVRAVCLDDKDVPHPASQVTPDREIDDVYDGELYRCIAGSRMQYVIGEYDSTIDISTGGRGAQTYICQKNEALYHTPGVRGGEGGTLVCRPQRPARDCNERSLLRRYGAGLKVLTILTTETYTAYREETVKESSSSRMSLSLDGGVGGVVY
ncbi:hypothetical protein [Caulobacter hibisci]|uniref:Uncharacterized protein n=1 Tax=Caulobacter hibisci TaxID=2035993 RepID=A0ABS0T4U6_9CAUL|nr:hypothetical protein [Caulobacter hibisci]MBI1686506.1 hypothetical protein [Caulobacter hibisci]